MTYPHCSALLDGCRKDHDKLRLGLKRLTRILPAVFCKACFWHRQMLFWLGQGALVFALEVVRESWHSCLFSHTAWRASTQMFFKSQWSPVVLWFFVVFKWSSFLTCPEYFKSFNFCPLLLIHKSYLIQEMTEPQVNLLFPTTEFQLPEEFSDLRFKQIGNKKMI